MLVEKVFIEIVNQPLSVGLLFHEINVQKDPIECSPYSLRFTIEVMDELGGEERYKKGFSGRRLKKTVLSIAKKITRSNLSITEFSKKFGSKHQYPTVLKVVEKALTNSLPKPDENKAVSAHKPPEDQKNFKELWLATYISFARQLGCSRDQFLDLTIRQVHDTNKALSDSIFNERQFLASLQGRKMKEPKSQDYAMTKEDMEEMEEAKAFAAKTNFLKI